MYQNCKKLFLNTNFFPFWVWLTAAGCIVQYDPLILTELRLVKLILVKKKLSRIDLSLDIPT
jgi:hypothetical protein